VKIIYLLLILILYINYVNAASWDDHGYLQVSSNGHFLQYEDGTEFFWMGDTAWHMPSLDRSEVITYLSDRKSKGFNVIQLTADNFDLEHKTMPNYDGEHPMIGSPPFSSVVPNEAYWTHIDYIVGLVGLFS